jgi:hypothetical protein
MPETPCTCTFYRPFQDAQEEAAWRRTHDLHIKMREAFDKLAETMRNVATKRDLADFEGSIGGKIDFLVTTVCTHSREIAELQRSVDASRPIGDTQE